jgi:excisionase family DNA binding protein
MIKPSPELIPEQQFTLDETARILCYSPTTVRREVARGRLRAIGRGRMRRFRLQDIRDYQERNR